MWGQTTYESVLVFDCSSASSNGSPSAYGVASTTAMAATGIDTFLEEAAGTTNKITVSDVGGSIYWAKGNGGTGIPVYCLKVGKASDGGSFTFAIDNSYDAIDRVVITGYGWKNTSTISINESDGQAPTSAATETTFTFDLKSSTRTIALSVTTSAVCITKIELFKESTSSSTPSISAENVNIECDDEEGLIEYTINNPVTGGSVVASDDADWLDVDDTASSSNEGSFEFICDANSETTARTATVTLTYTYNTNETVTKEVTVTQAGVPPTLTSISLSGDYPTVFSQGGTFSYEGMVVTAHYNNSTTKDVTADAEFSGYDLTTTGEQTVTVSYTEGDVTQTTNYSITVSSYVQPTQFDINLNNNLFGTTYTGSVSNITDNNPIIGTQDNVTVTYAGGGNHYVNNSQIRFYPSNKLTFEAPSGYNITKIVLTADGNWAATISVNSGTYTSSTKTWEGSATSVLFTGSGSGRCDMSKATITLAAQSTDPSITASNVNIAYNATEGEIAYTLTNEVTGGVLSASTNANWITLDQGTASPISFTCTANSETTERTATVTLTYTYGDNQEVTKDVTVTQAAAPVIYTTIPDLFAANTTTTATDVFVTFNNWVVSGVSTNGKNVFVTDNNGNGFVIYDGNGGLANDYAVGDILSGTAVSCSLKRQNGYAQISNPGASNLTITKDGNVTAVNIALADLAGVNTGALVSYQNLTCSVSSGKYYLSDGTTSIQLYNSLYAYNALEEGKVYNITGVYQQYGNTKEILPRNANDIEEVENVTVTATKEYSTFCGTCPLDFSNVDNLEAYVVSAINTSSATITKVEKVPAGTGLILKKKANIGTATDFTVPVASTTDNIGTNYLVGVTADKNMDNVANAYILSNGLFYKCSGGTLAAGKAYLVAEAWSTSTAPSFTIVTDNGDTTGIANVNRETITDNQYYTLDGRRVENPSNGIYIINGKKVVIK